MSRRSFAVVFPALTKNTDPTDWPPICAIQQRSRSASKF
jgi:hypothetical protein